MDNRNLFQTRLGALKRLVMINTLSSVFLFMLPPSILNRGTWLASMVAEYPRVPSLRNGMPRIEASIMYGDMLDSLFISNVTRRFRYGRDVMVSLYCHMLFESDEKYSILIARARNELSFRNPDDIYSNLADFNEYIILFEGRSRSPFKLAWAQFVIRLVSKDVNKIEYQGMIDHHYWGMKKLLENVLQKPVEEERLRQIIQKYSFESQTRRKPGQEDVKSFIKKGQPGDWKGKFTVSSARVFNNYYYQEMHELGYVNDESWMDVLKR